MVESCNEFGFSVVEARELAVLVLRVVVVEEEGLQIAKADRQSWSTNDVWMVLQLWIDGIQKPAELRIHSSLPEQNLEWHVVTDQSLKHGDVEIVGFDPKFLYVAVTL